ncbi:MAG: 50S ribosomal protein L21 [bacterium]|nr:50S ribosomal protein L21 [bacterium]
MYALVKMSGKQYRVREADVVRIAYLGQEIGQSVEFNEVMAVGQGEDLKIGQPYVEGALVKAEILSHGKDRKIIVFKKKRRKKYRRTQGHRQLYTELKITSIA